MTEHNYPTPITDLCNLLLDDSSKNSLAKIYSTLLNHLLIMQQDNHLGRDRFERSNEENGQRNGFKPRTLSTQAGKICLMRSGKHNTLVMCSARSADETEREY